MHLLFREQRSLEEEAPAVDLGQSPADLVLLSFSDADLGAAATAWSLMEEDRPRLRLANLAQLRHPLSVDLYAEQVLAHAKVIIVRLLGGLDYWRYGAEELSSLCRRQGSVLAMVAGDGRRDDRLAALSTAPAEALAALESYLREGGPGNVAEALRLAAVWGGLGEGPRSGPRPLPAYGEHALAGADSADPTRPLAVLVFYRSHLLSGDIAPIEEMARALQARGLRVRALYAASLKAPDAAPFIAATLMAWGPAVILNATGFSSRLQDGGASPLDAAGAPVLQLILAGSTLEAWRASSRGLSPSDMAMQLVLPELDGRLSTSAVSFKAPAERVRDLEFARTVHRAEPAQIGLAAEAAAGWARLSAERPRERRLAIVLSDYPGAAGASGQIGHAVGLDTDASLQTIIALLGEHGYDLGGAAPPAAASLSAGPCLPLDEYRALSRELPAAVQTRVREAWGEPEADPAVQAGVFVLPYRRLGRVIVAVQPDRGSTLDRKAGYHDPDTPPRHAYVAFYLWLRRRERIHALVHLGAHGTLEWLPGKALAPSEACFPTALIGGTPVIYPFIVNDPGEAAVAKRRLGAVVLGHLTPPLKSAGVHGEAAQLERLIDDYAAAEGLDARRTSMIRGEILERAEAAGLLVESGCDPDAPEDEALARLDAYLCDVKELQIRDGLHVFAQAPAPDRREALLEALEAASPGVERALLESGLDLSAPGEAAALIAALDGRFVEPGPAGAPSRGRADVLPTGRNLFSLDPRTTPTRSAMILAGKTAAALLRRHLQDQGDWPRTLVLDMWGSAALRTGGEDLALALILMGAAPTWDEASNRISGVEILPLAVLDRPRVDVTLRISGLFRDAFETQIEIFDMAVRAIAAREEPDEWNGLAKAARGLQGQALRRATARVYGAAPGAYGAGVSDQILTEAFAERADLGRAYLAASGFAYGAGLDGAADASGFALRVAEAQAFVHPQDHAEIDLLDGLDVAAHAGGFAAAANALGAAPALYHADTSRAETPRLRTLGEEVARVVRGRAANPAWIEGMMRHGYRGAGEICRALDGLYGVAAMTPTRFDPQFDLIFDATLGRPEVDAFLLQANPAARRTMLARFKAAAERDLWRPRRNSVAETLAGSHPCR